MRDYEQIRINSSQILSLRLSELEERFREVATEKVARRVASALYRLLAHIGKEVKEGVEISLSREELAQMTGTTLFTISRLMARWGEKRSSFLSPGVSGGAHPQWLQRAQDEDFENFRNGCSQNTSIAGDSLPTHFNHATGTA